MNSKKSLQGAIAVIAMVIGVAACAEQLKGSVALYAVQRDDGRDPRHCDEFPTADLIVGKGRAANVVCVTSERLSYQQGKLHIYPYKSRPTEIRLVCDGAYSKFFSENEGQEVALVANEKLIGLYGVVTPANAEDCGLLTAPTFSEALAMCDVFMDAWSLDSKNCENICATGDEAESKGICSVVTKGL